MARSAAAPAADPLARVEGWFAARGWEAFAFQREVWEAYGAGESGLIHAATGTGKTYAAWLGPLRAWSGEWKFHRGFVEAATLKAQTLLKQADTIFRLAPLRHAKVRKAERLGRDLAACPHLARLTSLGIEVSDYATAMVEIMADNADPKANDVYAALDMPFATLMGQVASALTK